MVRRAYKKRVCMYVRGVYSEKSVEEESMHVRERCVR